MVDQLVGNDTVEEVLTKQLKIKLMHFEHLQVRGIAMDFIVY